MENKENSEVIEETNVNETDTITEEKEDKKIKKKKKKKVGKIIANVITSIIFIVVVLDAIVGIVNMQRISNKEEPIWYLSTKKTETELKTVTEYHLGLYRIVITDTAKETKTTLKPFFLGD